MEWRRRGGPFTSSASCLSLASLLFFLSSSRCFISFSNSSSFSREASISARFKAFSETDGREVPVTASFEGSEFLSLEEEEEEREYSLDSLPEEFPLSLESSKSFDSIATRTHITPKQLVKLKDISLDTSSFVYQCAWRWMMGK